MSRRARYSKRTGRRAEFDESKVRRKAGRFADKPGAGDDAPIKTSGLTRDDVIEGLSDRAGRLNGRTIGEVLDASDDEMAALRALTKRHKAGEIQFRQGRRGEDDEALDVNAYLGTRYGVDKDEVHFPGERDEIEFEDFIEARIARAPADAIVLVAPIRSKRGGVGRDDLADELALSFDTPRNRPGFLGGEVGEAERLAIEDAAREYAQRHAKFFDASQDGGMLMLTIRRPSDSPYWKARTAAEAQFRRDGLTDRQIEDEIRGVADQRRAAAARAADGALSDQTRANTDAKLRAAYGAEVDRLEGLKGRDLFIARTALIRRFAAERGVTLPYA